MWYKEFKFSIPSNLKTMCEDIGYEVLDDIHALPERLLYLYRRLTM